MKTEFGRLDEGKRIRDIEGSILLQSSKLILRRTSLAPVYAGGDNFDASSIADPEDE